MLTGSTSKEESRDIFTRLTRSAGVQGKGRHSDLDDGGKEIKLCYVTVRLSSKSTFQVSRTEIIRSRKR